ncbi:hypothetical protein EVAR_42461_1 [Eumeta japonica]|uniref:Uncharacterized protein n=1 Tax=Eumeta variegata TaxID=151549 RepID=A0A4C1Y1T8_EUMVA|nr:hypothetical protein EVAR_42461_1 [Eumeta japonica]
MDQTLNTRKWLLVHYDNASAHSAFRTEERHSEQKALVLTSVLSSFLDRTLVKFIEDTLSHQSRTVVIALVTMTVGSSN